MSTRFFAWAAATIVACCGCRACSNCYDYSSPVAEPVGDGSGRAGSNLSDAQGPGKSHVVPASYESGNASERRDQSRDEYVFSLPQGYVASATELPWPDPDPDPDAEALVPLPDPSEPVDQEPSVPFSPASNATESASDADAAWHVRLSVTPAPFVR